MRKSGWRRSVVLAAALISGLAAPAAAETLNGSRLRDGLRYWQAGEYARARQAFESVLWIEDLPPDLRGQADSYAELAKKYLAGQSVLPSGYVVVGIGNYAEKNSAAGGTANDLFGAARVGGRVNIVASDTLTVNASLDYRYRNYDNADRRDDSDLRWSLGGSRPLGNVGWAFGARGWVSARGDGIRRNDAGLFTTWRFNAGDSDQFSVGGELRRRSYPYGRLRYRTRDIVEATASWTHAWADGRGSVGLAAHGGREFATGGRPDGNSGFVGLSPSVNLAVSDRWGVYAFGWWQNDRYAYERLLGDAGDAIAVRAARNDDLYDLGGGITWNFAPGWEVNPSVRYMWDRSNIPGFDYDAVELVMSLRRDF